MIILDEALGEEILLQFGVRGMKWGVRKPTTRGSTPPSKRAPKEAGGEKRQSLDMHSMSDAELRNAINRIKMQKEYAQLTAPPPKEKGRGRQLVENIVFSSAEAAGKKVLTGALTNVLENALPPALRGKPEKSKADQVAEKVLKGLKGEGKGKNDDSDDSPSPEKPKPGPQRPSPGSGPLPAPTSPAPSGGGARQAPPRHSSGARSSNPFRRSRPDAKKSSPPPVEVPNATVRPKPSGPAPVAALPRKPIATQGRPGSSGSGRTYSNDTSQTDRKGRGATQGRPGNTGQRKRRKWPFGHGDLGGVIIDILGETD